MRRLRRDFFGRDALEVAPELLNKVLVSGSCAARIVEVEAYRSDDPAAHTFGGPTPRTAVMFGPPGHLYVYLSYGMHHCANVVTGADGDGQAILLRAALPVRGVDEIRERRAVRASVERLTDGPGKLCQAMGLDRSDSGRDLCASHAGVTIADDGTEPPASPLVTARVGITKAVELPWRFVVPGVRVSGRPSPARPGRGSRPRPSGAPRPPARS